jgi:hypothetical protein
MTPLISKEFYGDYDEQVFAIAWGYFLDEVVCFTDRTFVTLQIERVLEVVYFKGKTFVNL